MKSTLKDSAHGGVRQRVSESVVIPIETIELAGDLVIPAAAPGIVVFAHGSGSSRHSPRNRFVAGQIQSVGLATLLFDLLTAAEEREDEVSAQLRFDIGLLTHRLVAATRWLLQQDLTRELGLGYFGSSTGAAAALVAAAELKHTIQAVVSRGGRPDFAGDALSQVTAATLFIVGENDEGVLGLNWSAYGRLTAEKQFKVVPGATHLFEEPGALAEVATHATAWFSHHLKQTRRI